MPQILMPRLSDTMEEGTIARWLKQPGDHVSPGEAIAEIDTDKATMELEAYDEGVLEEILLPEGASAAIGVAVAIIAGAAEHPLGGGGEAAGPAEAGPVTAGPVTAGPAEAGPAPLRTSPLARSLARRHGIDLTRIAGSGPGGRIVRHDVEAAIADNTTAPLPPTAPPTPTPATAAPQEAVLGLAAGGYSSAGGYGGEPEVVRPGGEYEEVPLGNVRRLTAERLSESARTPHFDLVVVVDAEALVDFRARVNESLPVDAEKVTVTDLVIKACARTLSAHRELNASWGGDRILRHRGIHVGLAVAVPEGLVVPVVRDADRAGLLDVARASHDLARRARQRALTPAELSGGTFTVSNLGMYGIDHFTAVINPPQAAILAVGAVGPQPVVRDGQVCVGTTMSLTLSVDHRVLDGASAAQFLAELRETLERPLRIVT